MGGFFRSNDYATVLVSAPFSLTTPAVLGNIIQTDYDVTLANLTCSIASVASNGTVTPFFNNTMDNLPADIAAGPFGGCIVMSFNPSIFLAGVWMIVISDAATTNYSQTSESFQWGGNVDLLTQVPAQNTRIMLTNGQSYRQSENPSWLFPAIIDPSTGLVGTSGSLTVFDPGFTGSSVPISLVANTLWVNISNATFTTSGSYLGVLTQTNNGVDYKSIGYINWGGTDTVALATAQDIGDTLAATRKAVKASAGNSTFNTGSGVVDFGEGDTFILVDGSNNPVSSPQNAVARSGSTF